jgi:hypothetical protein
MVYTEKVVIDKIEILEDGQMQIREATKIYRDGIEIAKTYNRKCISPDISSDNLLKEDSKVQLVAGVIFTKDIKDAYKAEKAKKELNK